MTTNLKTLFTMLLLFTAAAHADVVTGKVVDSQNRPIANADVLVRSLADFGEPIEFHRRKTNTNGVFKIDPKTHGQLHAIAWAAAPGKAPFGISLETTKNVIRLEDAQILSGRVVDKNNTPVKGVVVQCVGLRGGKDRSRYVDLRATPWKDKFSTVSDAQGKWQLRCVPVGDVAHLQMHDARFVTVDLSLKQGQDSVLTRVRPGAVLSGRIVDNKGKPVPNVTVKTYGGSQEHFGQSASVTDDEGRYELSGLPTGIYSIRTSTDSLVAAPLNTISAIEGKTLSVADIVMTKGGMLAGQVINSKTENPVQATEIHIQNIVKQYPFAVILTNQQGEYRQRLVPGRYQVKITSGGEGYVEQEITRNIIVKEGQTEIQNFVVDPGNKLKPIPDVSPPQEMIATFIKGLRQSPCNCGSFNYYSADHVVGGNSKDRALAPIAKQAEQELGQVTIEATDFKIIPNADHSDQVNVSFTVRFVNDDQGYELRQNDHVTMKLVTDDKGKQWKIVPQKPHFYLADFYSDNLPPVKSTFTNFWASLMAYPQKMQNGFYLYKSEKQIEKLGEALILSGQDYDERIDITPEQFKERVLPYAQDESLFTAPGDADGITSYSMNPHIKGLNLLEIGPQFSPMMYLDRNSYNIPSPYTLVMLYLGHDQTLDFKYGDYSVVYFMDGHVEKVTREQAKELRWKP